VEFSPSNRRGNVLKNPKFAHPPVFRPVASAPAPVPNPGQSPLAKGGAVQAKLRAPLGPLPRKPAIPLSYRPNADAKSVQHKSGPFPGAEARLLVRSLIPHGVSVVPQRSGRSDFRVQALRMTVVPFVSASNAHAQPAAATTPPVFSAAIQRASSSGRPAGRPVVKAVRRLAPAGTASSAAAPAASNVAATALAVSHIAAAASHVAAAAPTVSGTTTASPTGGATLMSTATQSATASSSAPASATATSNSGASAPNHSSKRKLNDADAALARSQRFKQELQAQSAQDAIARTNITRLRMRFAPFTALYSSGRLNIFITGNRVLSHSHTEAEIIRYVGAGLARAASGDWTGLEGADDHGKLVLTVRYRGNTFAANFAGTNCGIFHAGPPATGYGTLLE